MPAHTPKSITPARLLAATALTASAALTLTSCASAAPSDAAAGDLVPVTFALSFLPDPALSGLAYAIEEGLFEEAGIDLEVLPWGQSTPESLVAAGEADLGFATDIRTALLAMGSGAEIESLMAVYQHTPYVLTTLDGTGHDSPADLAGGTYGGFGSPMELAVVNDMITADGGGTPAEEVTLSTATFEALVSERVDSVLSFPTQLAEFEANGTAVTTWESTDFGVPDGYAYLVIGGDDYLSANADTAAAFVGALQAGYAAALEDPDAATAALLALYPDEIDPDVAAFVGELHADRLFVSPDGVVGSQSAEVWQQNADWLIEKGLLTDAAGQPLDAFDTSTVFSDEFLR